MAAPATCHHTETLLMIASRWLLKMLASAARKRMTTKMTKTRWRLQFEAHVSLNRPNRMSTKFAAP